MLILFRKRFLPLPFEYNLGMGDRRAPETLGIVEQFGKKELEIIFDHEGSIWFDNEEFGKIIQITSTSINRTFMSNFKLKYQTVVGNLKLVCDKSVIISIENKPAKCLELLATWYENVMEYMPFLIITKFLPDSVLNVISSNENSFIEKHPDSWYSIMSPTKLQSSAFTKAILELYVSCLEQNIQLEVDNNVSSNVEIIDSFKKRWAGFGPREWELPGYESTFYLLDELNKFFKGLSLNDAKNKLLKLNEIERNTSAKQLQSLEALKSESNNFVETEELLSFLWLMQEISEAENQVFRSSFYFGALPLLRVISNYFCEQGKIEFKEDILFLFATEIINHKDFDFAEILEKRKKIFWNIINEENREISKQRLKQILDENYTR
jgi:hypothetical protein